MAAFDVRHPTSLQTPAEEPSVPLFRSVHHVLKVAVNFRSSCALSKSKEAQLDNLSEELMDASHCLMEGKIKNVNSSISTKVLSEQFQQQWKWLRIQAKLNC